MLPMASDNSRVWFQAMERRLLTSQPTMVPWKDYDLEGLGIQLERWSAMRLCKLVSSFDVTDPVIVLVYALPKPFQDTSESCAS